MDRLGGLAMQIRVHNLFYCLHAHLNRFAFHNPHGAHVILFLISYSTCKKDLLFSQLKNEKEKV
jgi:hypothetical protein